VASYLLSVFETLAGILLLTGSAFVLTLTIEDLGRRGKFSDSFTGSVISPIFTSLPELVVIIVALLFIGSGSGSEIAVGTIIGEPFMVSAIGFPIMATILLLAAGRNGNREDLDAVLPKIFVFIGLTFPIMLVPFYFHFTAVRVSVAIILIFLYVIFLRFVKGSGLVEEEPKVKIENLKLLVLALVIGIILLLAGSTILVGGINSLATELNVNRELLSILIIPIGGIAPETMNSFIWASRGKMNLAIGSLIGEELLFATLYPALGIIASQWGITSQGILAIVLTSSFSILVGLISYRFRRAFYVYILFFVLLIVFFFFIY
jgi:cation:H+ antiporter